MFEEGSKHRPSSDTSSFKTLGCSSSGPKAFFFFFFFGGGGGGGGGAGGEFNLLGSFVVIVLSDEPRQKARVGRPQTSSSPPVISLLAVPRQLFCFGSLVILDAARYY